MFKNLHQTFLLVVSSAVFFFLAQQYKEYLETLLKIPLASLSTPMSDNTLSTTPLALWLQTRFNELYESVPPPEEADFKALFYSTFADNAWIYLNHEKMNEDKYLARFNSYNFAIKHAEVDWKELVDASASGSGSNNKGGIVSGFFVVHRYMKFRIRASAAERLSYNTFSAKIEVKPNASPASDGSRLRITELMITTVDKAAPIHFPDIHHTS